MNNKIPEQFIIRPRSMLESKVFQSLGLAEHRVLNRIELEHLRHGGKDNGSLPVTYQNFADHGVRRNSLHHAINGLVRKGFVRITRKGRSGKNGVATEYRLTYLHANNRPPTNDWKTVDRNRYRNVTEKSIETLPNRSDLQQNPGIETLPNQGSETLPLSRESSSGSPPRASAPVYGAGWASADAAH
jgi:hypothetical protein